RRVLLHGESLLGVERVLTRPDGTRILLHASAVPLRDAAGAVAGMVASFTDITQRHIAEEALRQTSRRLRQLSRRLLEVQEQERRHLARELHDEIGQWLTGLSLSLGMLTGRSDVAPALAQVKEL